MLREIDPPIGVELAPGVALVVDKVQIGRKTTKSHAIVWNETVPYAEAMVDLSSIRSRNAFIKEACDVAPRLDKTTLKHALIQQSILVSQYLAAVEAKTAQKDEPKPEQNWEKIARGVLEASDPLEVVRDALPAIGYGGNPKPALIVYLAMTSRLLYVHHGTMPLHLLLRGKQGSGKSYTVETVQMLFPEDTYRNYDAGSERAIIYDNADLAHRTVVFGEADSIPKNEDSPVASAIRHLLQKNELVYYVVVQDLATGEFVTKEIRKPGPSTMITTSVRLLGGQLMSRLWVVDSDKDFEAIAAALHTQDDLELHNERPDQSALIAFQAYLQQQAPWHVVVPYTKAITSEILEAAVSSDVLRDRIKLNTMIKAVTVLRHRHRERDEKGRLMATIEDYATVYELIKDVYTENVTKIPGQLRKVVDFVSKHPGSSANDVADYLDIASSTASYHIRRGIKAGYLIDRQDLKPGREKALFVGDPLPEETGLPSPDAVEKAWILYSEGPFHVKHSKYRNRHNGSELQDLERQLTEVYERWQASGTDDLEQEYNALNEQYKKLFVEVSDQ